MGSNEGQTYCLRWNNHKSNLVEILDALIKMECYVDCTIVVDDQVQFKAHRVVLAANSPYFQAILQDVPMDHCSILFPGVKEFEMRALLEYMYTGEVNVTESQIPRIIKIAKQLEVKGLYDMTDLKSKFDKVEEPNASATAFPHNNNSTIKPNINPVSPVNISTSNNVTSAAQSSSSSPPYNSFKPYQNIYSRSPVHTVSDRPPWPLSSHLESPVSSHQQGVLSRAYETVADMNPLKRKKLSSISSMLSTPIDTPILRNVLAQPNPTESAQAVPLICPPTSERGDRGSNHSNGTDYSDKKYRMDEMHSPYTDKSFEDESMEQPSNFASDSRIASYVPQQNQKPEWKRYKQYTRNDILAAIECVKNGMSALQASRKYGVPSRTLYDKVKKMGITTGRPQMNRSMKRSPSNGSNAAPFPYGLSGASHHYPDMPTQSHSHDDERSREREGIHQLPPTIPHPAAALLGPSFLQQALDARGGDISQRDAALHAMALAAAAHAAANGVSSSPGTHGNARSPSPSLLMKFMRPPSTEIHHVKDSHIERESLHESFRESMRDNMRESLRDFERERDRERERERDRERERELEREREQIVERHALLPPSNGEEDDKVEDLSMPARKEITSPRISEQMERSPSPPPLSSTPIPPQRPPSQPTPLQMQHGVIVPPLSKVIQRLKEARYEENYNNTDSLVDTRPESAKVESHPSESN